MGKMKKISLGDLIPDDKNLNIGTPRGTQMLENSLRSYGAGRSILVDKNGRIIAGNKTYEGAGSIGIDRALVVETDGTELVVVKRTDIDLDSEAGRGLAISDNRVSELNLDWDVEALTDLTDSTNIDPGEWWTDAEMKRLQGELEDALDGSQPEPPKPEESRFLVVVDCKDDEHQEEVYKKLKDLGLECNLRWES